ncbi:MAG: FAD-dependent oxidoreductase, partial [Rhodococcus fascians]
DANFDDLWAPLHDYLTAHDVRGRPGTVRFHTGVGVSSVEARGDDSFVVTDDSGAELDADGVVLATDVGSLQRLVAASPTLGTEEWRKRVQDLGSAPQFAVLLVWLERPVAAERPGFLGTGNVDPLDNISVLERYEYQAAMWARRNRGSVVELHAYALDPDADLTLVRKQLLDRLHTIFPETADANIVDERMLLRQDCPRFAPGDYADRPGVVTPQPGLVLAGDGIRIDLPVALMERAATTGWTAANTLLTRRGVAGHTLHTVPTRGRSALLRMVAERERRNRR